MTLALERCFQHGSRGASARCPECRRYYCRECITEHDGRVLCTGCLEQRRAGGERRKRRGLWPYAVAAVCNLVWLYLLVHAAGSLLLRLPSSFHDGSLLGSESAE